MLPSLESSRKLEEKYNRHLQRQVALITKLTDQIIRDLPTILTKAGVEPPPRKDSPERFDAWEVDPYYDPETGQAFYAGLLPELDTHPVIDLGDDDALPFIAPLAFRSDARKARNFQVVDQVIDRFRIEYGKGFAEGGARAFLETLDKDVAADNLRKWKRHAKEAAKASTRLSEAAVSFAVSESSGLAVNPRRRFISRNINLIKFEGRGRIPAIPARHAKVLKRVLRDGINRQLRVESIRDKLTELNGVTRRRAETIARDQVGKYHGQMMQERQSKLGVDSYFWRTVRDELVRDEHEEREGDEFQWDLPPSDGHPGQPVNCRCSAEPNIEAVFASLEKAA